MSTLSAPIELPGSQTYKTTIRGMTGERKWLIPYAGRDIVDLPITPGVSLFTQGLGYSSTRPENKMICTNVDYKPIEHVPGNPAAANEDKLYYAIEVTASYDDNPANTSSETLETHGAKMEFQPIGFGRTWNDAGTFCEQPITMAYPSMEIKYSRKVVQNATTEANLLLCLGKCNDSLWRGYEAGCVVFLGYQLSRYYDNHFGLLMDKIDYSFLYRPPVRNIGGTMIGGANAVWRQAIPLRGDDGSFSYVGNVLQMAAGTPGDSGWDNTTPLIYEEAMFYSLLGF